MKEVLIITPKTKVLQLLEAYPELENVLIDLVPAFSKLKNPVLRKTIARITTLQQAAVVGQVNLDHLINTLRSAVGQDKMVIETEILTGAQELPDWTYQLPLHKELDARPMLETGEHPVGQVLEDLRKMPSGSRYLLIAPFLPAPLIDKAASLGANHYVEQLGHNIFNVHFRMD